MEKIGLIIPFYNGHKYIDRLVRSISEAAGGYSCKIYIVDNSPEQVPMELSVTDGVEVEVIRERPAIGYGKACNVGYVRCMRDRMDFAVIINQDGYLSPRILPHLLKPFEADESVMISAPMLRVYGNDEIEDFFVKYYISQVPAMISDIMSGKERQYYEMKAVSGACFALRLNNNRYAYEYLFDPIFHMYYEDEDLCRRIAMINGKMVLVTRAADFYHQHSDTTDQENRETIEANKLLAEKIYRLKDPYKRPAIGLYGILASAFTTSLSHILRGSFAGLREEIKATCIFLGKIPRILRRRNQEMILSGLKR